MSGRRAALVAIGAEIVMAATIGLSGMVGLHGHASASAGDWAPNLPPDGGVIADWL